MIGALVQLALLIGMTQGVRGLARRMGPRRGGLLTGVPTTTALVLVGYGIERGLVETMVAAEACLVGLAAAAALPLAYGRAAGAGWSTPASALAAVGGYAVVSLALWWVPMADAFTCIGVATVGVAVACRLAEWVLPTGRALGRNVARPVGSGWALAYRTGVPTGSFFLVRLVRNVTGGGGAGRFLIFPGGSLAILVMTHLEAGPGVACRLAAGMPAGNVGMLAFLTAFRLGCPRLGLAWGTALGFASAFGALLCVGLALGARKSEPLPSMLSTARAWCSEARREVEERRALGLAFGFRAPRGGRGFCPRFEVLAG